MMYRFSVFYPPPKDPAHFRDYYVHNHLPKARELPNIKATRYAFNVEALEGDSPYFCIFEADFDSKEEMFQSLQSEQGQLVAADVPNYATGGAIILHFEVKS